MSAYSRALILFILVGLGFVSAACTGLPPAAGLRPPLPDTGGSGAPAGPTPAGPAPTAKSTPTAAATPTIEAAAGEALFLGDAFQAAGYYLAGVQVADPAPAGRQYVPKVDRRLVAVEIVIGNLAGERLAVNALNAALFDRAGQSYAPLLAGVDGQLSTVNLFPGERVKGWVAFELPPGATPAGLRYTTALAGGEALQVGLAAAPAGHRPQAPDWPPARPANPAGSLPGLGEIHELDGYSLRAAGLQDPAEAGMFYEPRAGERLVAVEVELGNGAGEKLNVNPLNALLVDRDGFVYPAVLAGHPGQLNPANLGRGQTATGWVTFSLPEGALPAGMKYVLSPSRWDQVLHVGLR